MTAEDTIRSYFAAMRRGAAAEDDMLALFADDVVYLEPFSGIEHPASGLDEVRDRLRMGWNDPLPEMELDVLSITSSGDTAESKWVCRSPALPGPVRGTDRYTFVDGLISRIEVVLDGDGHDID